MTFTEKLLHLMEKNNIKNRSQLSKQSGIPYTTIVGFFEKGTENIRRTTLIKLSDFFDCSLEYLVSDDVIDENIGKNISFNITSKEMQHIKKYRELDTHGKDMVDTVLNKEYERYKLEKNKYISCQTAARSKENPQKANKTEVISNDIRNKLSSSAGHDPDEKI